jgi:hypothetical protein
VDDDTNYEANDEGDDLLSIVCDILFFNCLNIHCIYYFICIDLNCLAIYYLRFMFCVNFFPDLILILNSYSQFQILIFKLKNPS